ncbi:MAG TPA: hypothetical protein VJ912_01990 [Candidatus Nanoarchaeia archaeon]|nr:hypothetical protein [Candidatus Nanoarchaeia archaeon]
MNEKENNFKYIIKSKDYRNSYLQKGKTGCYSGDIGTAIHDELPSFIPEKGDTSHDVIRSDNPRFREILEEELFGNEHANGLEKSIYNDEQRLKSKKKNRDLIVGYLNGLNKEK